MEELQGLKDQMEAMGMSIAEAVSVRTLCVNYNTYTFPSGNGYSRPKAWDYKSAINR